jgi:aminopeptidase N
MLRIMSRWQRYDPVRQALMRTQLRRILDTQGVSRDVFEIASKSLQE